MEYGCRIGNNHHLLCKTIKNMDRTIQVDLITYYFIYSILNYINRNIWILHEKYAAVVLLFM